LDSSVRDYILQISKQMPWLNCAQFCAYRVSRRVTTDCDGRSLNSNPRRYLQQFIANRRISCNFLISRPAVPYKQEVAGSSPVLPTITLVSTATCSCCESRPCSLRSPLFPVLCPPNSATASRTLSADGCAYRLDIAIEEWPAMTAHHILAIST